MAYSDKVVELATQYDGTIGDLPSYSEYGGYPLFYIDSYNNVLCADCANKDDEYNGDIVDYDINHEDDNMYCNDCSRRIESACED